MMNNLNFEFDRIKENIRELELKHQNLIHQFSEKSMQYTVHQRQKNELQRTSRLIQHQIDNTLVSDEDFDKQILKLETELTKQLQIEEQFNLSLTEKHNMWENRTFIRELRNTFHTNYQIEEQQFDSEIEQLKVKNTELLEYIKEKELESQKLLDETKILEEKNTHLIQEISSNEKLIQIYFPIRWMQSFLNLDRQELEMTQQLTPHLDLFYATSLRLGIISYLQHQYLEAFINLSYLPSSFLQSYQLTEIFNEVKIQHLHRHLVPYSPERLFAIAQKSQNPKEMESLLRLSIQASIDNKVNFIPAYIALLEYYLRQNLWLHTQTIIEKIKTLDNKAVAIGMIIRAFHDAIQNMPITNQGLLQYQQLSLIAQKIPELNQINNMIDLNSIHQMIEKNPQVQTIEVILSFINQKIYSLEACSSFFLKPWCQYQLGINLCKENRIKEAIEIFKDIILEYPYFIEAHIKLEEYTEENGLKYLAMENK